MIRSCIKSHTTSNSSLFNGFINHYYNIKSLNVRSFSNITSNTNSTSNTNINKIPKLKVISSTPNNNNSVSSNNITNNNIQNIKSNFKTNIPNNDITTTPPIDINQIRNRVYNKLNNKSNTTSTSSSTTTIKSTPPPQLTNNNNSNSNSNTFVSSYYKVNEEQVLQYLERKKLQYRISGQEIIVKECPLCPDTKGKLDNLWKLYISRETSGYNCFRCSNKGSWFDFKANLGDLSMKQISSATSTPAEEEITTTIADIKRMATYAHELDNHPDVIQRLTGKGAGERGLSLDVCKLYNIGVTTQSFFVDDSWKEQKCITFPWTNLDKKGNVITHRCKLRALESKALQRIEPKGGKWGFFGWHTVPLDAKEIVLTEGEYDAMAVYQSTGKPTISLPNGANSLPIALLPLLERFEKIYLWMDDDIPGQEGAAKFAEKLGIQRTFIVRTKQGEDNGPKDANDALLQGRDLNKILESASNIPHDQICDFSDVRASIHSELRNPSSVNGVKSQWFPTFNKLLKGHRKGELTIFSGPTGIGKTTLLSQLSLDFSTQGTRTLWGSFEIKVSRLAKKMMGQYAGVDLEQHVDNYNKIADDFAALPMYFMRFFGSTQVDKVLDAMEYAVYVHDVEHIILDNLQFMLSGQTKAIERFETMDESIEKLRKFATQKNVHITLVIHPRKQLDADTPLNISDIFGTAKATQVCIILIIFILFTCILY
ncbi:T7-like mitochondrial DNA helicase [Heterostelium album PN500]|uniref:T7-like mitochondrial DNA helicase n=1 Tax=Heterostelium pallidum (strain ATCC 26659 / Pp 5 / PN500) TaxID=670386 RepID=D3B6K2_HETP5|nr:T7-like mitochondrial DNA helicase [Heterostelium album PN500]EFA82972.1 T7-like mitochondrial DNA helicase [Heterostelium album PN500]|eukprot:XP_020435089.1 T7-like mitochondrial DNA helicase [Heterostelium album PN500]